MDISPVLESLKHFGETVVWNNSTERRDCKVLGRFVAAAKAHNDVVYVQDDDCIVDTEALVALYQPGEVLVNMPINRRAEYRGTGISLIGWGCIFPLVAMQVIERYTQAFECDELLMRECDRVFTFLNRGIVRQVAVPFRQLAYAHGVDRMGKEARHRADFVEIRGRLATL